MNTNGNSNVAIGPAALRYNGSGTENTAVGGSALLFSSRGGNSVASGYATGLISAGATILASADYRFEFQKCRQLFIRARTKHFSSPRSALPTTIICLTSEFHA